MRYEFFGEEECGSDYNLIKARIILPLIKKCTTTKIKMKTTSQMNKTQNFIANGWGQNNNLSVLNNYGETS